MYLYIYSERTKASLSRKGETMTYRYMYNRFRIYPDKKQTAAAFQTLGSCRYVYNLYLNSWDTCLRYTGKGMSYAECFQSLIELKKVHAWLRSSDSSALTNSLRNLSRAFQEYSMHRRSYPAFHRKGHRDSYTCTNSGGSIRVLNNRNVILPGLGKTRAGGIRFLKGIICSATVIYETTGKWYCSLLYKTAPAVPFPVSGKTVGIDLGIHDYLIRSDGIRIPNPRFMDSLAKKLAREQRKLDRKCKANTLYYVEKEGKRIPVFRRPLKDCRNYQKQKKRVACIYEKIRRCRLDFEHKLSTELIKNHDVICMEDLDIKGMLADKRMSRQISDVSWSEFTSMLEYKAAWYGRKILRVPRFYPSSQICSVCGSVNNAVKDLSIRTWECPVCHSIHDRDINAARNIKKEALKRAVLLK